MTDLAAPSRRSGARRWRPTVLRRVDDDAGGPARHVVEDEPARYVRHHGDRGVSHPHFHATALWWREPPVHPYGLARA